MYSIFLDYGREAEYHKNYEFICVSVESAREEVLRIVNEDCLESSNNGWKLELPHSVSIAKLVVNKRGLVVSDLSSMRVLTLEPVSVRALCLDITNFFNDYKEGE